MRYYIYEQVTDKWFDSTQKPRDDINKIIEQTDTKKLMIKSRNSNGKGKIKEKIINYISWNIIINKTKEDDEIIIQYPLIYGRSFLKKVIKKLNKKHVKIILFVHDLFFLRFQNSSKNELAVEKFIIENSDFIISHNENMTKMIRQTMNAKKIIELELFDYLTNNNIIHKNEVHQREICFAGNLAKEKAAFIYELEEDKMNFNILIYGENGKNISNKKIVYKGKYSAEELPNCLEGICGLVWDGKKDEIDAEEGYKGYLKFNSPHKISCYLTAGKPVIVWRKSAAAKFVKKYNIGYLINEIYDINNIDFKDLDEKTKNARDIGAKIRDGYFTKRALEKVE